MTLRDALVALERWDVGDLFQNGSADGEWVAYVDIAAILAAHPAVEGDAAQVVLDRYVAECVTHHDDAPKELRIEAMRAALDAAWPGMVADAGRYRKLRESSNLVAGMSGVGIGFACGNWEKDEDDKRKLDAAIDAMEASRG